MFGWYFRDTLCIPHGLLHPYMEITLAIYTSDLPWKGNYESMRVFCATLRYHAQEQAMGGPNERNQPQDAGKSGSTFFFVLSE